MNVWLAAAIYLCGCFTPVIISVGFFVFMWLVSVGQARERLLVADAPPGVEI